MLERRVRSLVSYVVRAYTHGPCTRFAAALCEGKLHLHLIEPKNEDSGHPDEIYLPDDSVAGNDKAVVSHALTDSMCIYAMQGSDVFVLGLTCKRQLTLWACRWTDPLLPD